MSEALKYRSSFSLGELEMALKNDEQWWGGIIALGSAESYTIAELEEPYPEIDSLILLPMAGETALPSSEGRKLICQGKVFIRGEKMNVAAYRISET